ncbi:styrene monooxygenase/indole monooxygenase family protein [Nostoc sp. TCL26-01]|uniref:styrene monooxygenase/indole monooxygenase family protein n=1 Tax=Nostoc sp. TCL26-01 TaxID=2576904 RepID=UPI0015BBC0AA|nr:styrene monooxygenase/indole monooxygenase family protein [Nostoc sp. TCL26-01]QLE55973.1 oxygenase [Nostoc sp. TCL26-01]
MRRIAIIGAGQAGLHLAVNLVDAGYGVTLFSDRTPEAILNGKPGGMPVLFPNSMQLEERLNFWQEEFPGSDVFRSEVLDPEGNLALTVSYPLEQPWQAVDQRLKFFTWMQEFVKIGGELVVQKMTLADLEECAKNYDLVLVSSGRGSFANLFARDAQKSTHDKPKRHITSIIVTGLQGDPVDLRASQMTVIPEVGEIIQMPFYAKGKFSAHVIAFEACPGGKMDQFSQIQSGQEVLEMSKTVIQQLKPWHYEFVKNMELADEQAWINGAITPTVRHPIGRLPSGAIVMGIGDAVILQDPLTGQGANSATKMAHLVKQQIIEHGNQRFDESWMQRVFDEFWNYAQYTYAFTDCLLSPPDYLQDIMMAMAENPEITRDYLNGLNHPPSLSSWFFDAESAKEYLAQKKASVEADNLNIRVGCVTAV